MISRHPVHLLSLDYKIQVWVYAKALEEAEGLSYLPKCEVRISQETTNDTKKQRDAENLDGVMMSHKKSLMSFTEFIEKRVSLLKAEMRGGWGLSQ